MSCEYYEVLRLNVIKLKLCILAGEEACKDEGVIW